MQRASRCGTAHRSHPPAHDVLCVQAHVHGKIMFYDQDIPWDEAKPFKATAGHFLNSNWGVYVPPAKN